MGGFPQLFCHKAQPVIEGLEHELPFKFLFKFSVMFSVLLSCFWFCCCGFGFALGFLSPEFVFGCVFMFEGPIMPKYQYSTGQIVHIQTYYILNVHTKIFLFFAHIK